MAPPWTNAWDESKPADTDLANTLGTQGRQVKLDVRQRMDWQHVWNQNVNDDGGHRFVLIASAYHPANTESVKASGFSLTGANAQSCLDLAGTWNTSGTPTGIKLNITDTASNVNSLLLDLQVGGVSKFKVDKAGNVTAAGSLPGGGLLQTVLSNGSATNTLTLGAGYNTLSAISVTITPQKSSSRVRIQAYIPTLVQYGGSGANVSVKFKVTRGLGGPTVVEFFNMIGAGVGTNTVTGTVALDCIDSPATTSATTYYVQAAALGGSGTAVCSYDGGNGNGVMTMVATEIV